MTMCVPGLYKLTILRKHVWGWDVPSLLLKMLDVSGAYLALHCGMCALKTSPYLSYDYEFVFDGYFLTLGCSVQKFESKFKPEKHLMYLWLCICNGLTDTKTIIYICYPCANHLLLTNFY